jgi:hypothetical protein
MLSDDPNAKPLQPDKLLDIYKDIGNNIRVTDDISFKLLGIVPLASGVGSGALTILEKSKPLEGYSWLAVTGLSALGALVTLGLFRWELRNIQKCNWLISRAANFETQILHKENLQFDGMTKQEHLSAKTISEVRVSSLFETPWGKTQAEKLVYLAAIGAWLVPLGIAMYKLFSPA